MSVLGAMYAAVSGLSANSNALSAISDNIANSNTVGYKDTSTQFSTLVSQSGSPNLYSPGGVTSNPLTNVMQQGILQSTSSSTDLAISGGGLFVVDSSAAGPNGNGIISYTRAGSFTADANGNLKNTAGLFLQGEPLTAAEAQQIAQGTIPALRATSVTSLQTVNVNNIGGSAIPSANVTLAANLPATDTQTSPARTMTVPVFDSLGIEHDMTLSFSRTNIANQWQVSASIANAGATTVNIAAGDNLVQFNPNGSLKAAGTTFNTANAVSITWDPTITGATSPQKLTFNVGADGQTSGLSQLGSTYTVGNITQDGVKFGNFTNVTIDQNGIVTANFDNGLKQAIYMIPLATFPNEDGLARQTGDAFLQTTASGNYLLRQAGTGSAGQIASSELENSTVDIATEFSNMIVTQRAYQANSKIITTADQMLQSLLSIQTG